MEFEKHRTFFDSFTLSGLSHPSGSSLAMSRDGGILAFDPESVMAPEYAVNSTNTDVTTYLSDMDNNQYYGDADEWVELNFGQISDYQELSLVIKASTTTVVKNSLIIQVPGLNGEWINVSHITPYNKFAFQCVDLNEYLPIEDDLIVRIYWTSGHILDVAWLYIGAQIPITYYDCPLLDAQHSIYGNITDRILSDDDKYAEIVPYQEIILGYVPLPELETPDIIDFVLRTNGYYYPFNTIGTSQTVNLTIEIEGDMQTELNVAIIRQVNMNSDGANEIVAAVYLNSTNQSSQCLSFTYHPEETYTLVYNFMNRTNSTRVTCEFSSVFDSMKLITEGNGELLEKQPLSLLLHNITGLWTHPYSKSPMAYKNTPIGFQILNSFHKDYSNYNMTAIHWDFGDGIESDELNPSHSYSTPGIYLVNMNMTFYWHGTYIIRDKQCYITVPAAEPVADFNTYQEVALTLTVAGRKDNTVGIRIYEDGALIQSQDVMRTAGPSNTITIGLNKNLSRIYEIELVYDADHRGANPTSLKFTSGVTTLFYFKEFNTNNGYHQIISVPTSYLEEAVQNNPTYWFDASGSYDIDGEIVAYEWNFGDENTGTGELITHEFTEMGTYIVTLIVIDDYGTVGTKTTELVIR